MAHVLRRFPDFLFFLYRFTISSSTTSWTFQRTLWTTGVHSARPYLYILQSCWGRSAQHHSQGSPISLYWPPWRSTHLLHQPEQLMELWHNQRRRHPWSTHMDMYNLNRMVWPICQIQVSKYFRKILIGKMAIAACNFSLGTIKHRNLSLFVCLFYISWPQPRFYFLNIDAMAPKVEWWNPQSSIFSS